LPLRIDQRVSAAAPIVFLTNVRYDCATMTTRSIKKPKTAPARQRPTLAQGVSRKGKVTKEFADQVAEFIKRYRPALEALAKR